MPGVTRSSSRLTATLAVALLAQAAPAAAADWPAFRGPRGDGISGEPLADAPWTGPSPKVAWRAKVGPGYASPVGVGGRVLVFHLAGGAETLTSHDAATGKVAWSDSTPGGIDDSYAGTRATPLVEGERVFTLGGKGELVARDLATGKRLWQINVLGVSGADPLQWGCSANLLSDGELLYLQTGDGGPIAIAVRKADGKVKWRAGKLGKAGYAQPILVDLPGPAGAAGSPSPPRARVLVVFSGESLDGLDPDTGAAKWTVPWKTSYGVNASTPIHKDGRLFITSAYGKGAAMLRITPAGAETVWESRDAQARFNPPILDGEHLYLNSEGELKCLRWSDGKEVWSVKKKELQLGMGGSLLRVGDKLVTFGERGTLSIVRATPAGFRKLLQSEKIVAGDQSWATPLLYGNRLYVRGEGELVALTVSPR